MKNTDGRQDFGICGTAALRDLIAGGVEDNTLVRDFAAQCPDLAGMVRGLPRMSAAALVWRAMILQSTHPCPHCGARAPREQFSGPRSAECPACGEFLRQLCQAELSEDCLGSYGPEDDDERCAECQAVHERRESAQDDDARPRRFLARGSRP